MTGGPLLTSSSLGPSPGRASAARATMAALATSTDVFETFFDQAEIGLALADLSGRYVRVNATYATLLGRSPEDLIGVLVTDVVHPDDRDGEDLRLGQLVSGEVAGLQRDQRYVSAHGGVSWVMHGITVVREAGSRPAWLAVSAQDITERRRVEQDLQDLTAALAAQALRDPLTGLANRQLLEERLRASLARDARSGESTALMFLDLDGFKTVNDRHGHATGDAVLKTIAERLRGAVRPSDTIARMGGDEFVVLVEGAVGQGVQALHRRLAEAVTGPIEVGDNVVQVGVSIGVAVSTAGQDDPATLLARADSEMYSVKRAR